MTDCDKCLYGDRCGKRKFFHGTDWICLQAKSKWLARVENKRKENQDQRTTDGTR